MADLQIAIDESGGIEPLINYKTLEEQNNPPHLICFSGAAIIETTAFTSFESD